MATAALRDALDALGRWASGNREHAGWVMQGAPRLTEREHVARFGHPYTKQPGKRGKA